MQEAANQVMRMSELGLIQSTLGGTIQRLPPPESLPKVFLQVAINHTGAILLTNNLNAKDHAFSLSDTKYSTLLYAPNPVGLYWLNNHSP